MGEQQIFFSVPFIFFFFLQISGIHIVYKITLNKQCPPISLATEPVFT